MNAKLKSDLTEATRLTREGRLLEAMALLRGANGTAGSGDSPRSSPSSGMGGLRAFFDTLRQRGAPSRVFGPAQGQQSRTPRVPLPEGARFDELSFANEAGSRLYKIYVPSGYAGQPLPLVIMLHGCTQSPDDFAAGTQMNALAEEQTFLVAYPAQAQSANVSKCWNWYKSEDQHRDQGEPSIIAGITQQIVQDYAVDPRRIYVAGLSAGGAAAAIMGAAYPDLYAAIAIHSGLACGAAHDVASAFTAMRQGGSDKRHALRNAGRSVPTIVFHGDRDTTVNPTNGDQIIAQSNVNVSVHTRTLRGVTEDGVGYTRTIGVDENGRTILEHWLIHGGGHAWSGGSLEGSYTDPRGPDASREMLRFFFELADARLPEVSVSG